MHLRQHSKRVGIACAIAGTMLGICLVAYNAQSSCEPVVGAQSISAASSRGGGAAPHPVSGDHPKPWLRMVVTHAISIAGKLAAS